MFIDWRWIIFAAANLLLCFLNLLANEACGGSGVSFYLYGACLIFPALLLRPWAGWAAVAIPALLMEATLPANYGTAMTIWTLVWLLLRACHRQLNAENLPQLLLATQAANALCFLITALVQGEASGAYWLRAATDLFLSQAVLFLLTPWFLAFQNQILRYVHLDNRIREDAAEQ